MSQQIQPETTIDAGWASIVIAVLVVTCVLWQRSIPPEHYKEAVLLHDLPATMSRQIIASKKLTPSDVVQDNGHYVVWCFDVLDTDHALTTNVAHSFVVFQGKKISIYYVYSCAELDEYNYEGVRNPVDRIIRRLIDSRKQ